jgi:hypothetical protein
MEFSMENQSFQSNSIFLRQLSVCWFLLFLPAMVYAGDFHLPLSKPEKIREIVFQGPNQENHYSRDDDKFIIILADLDRLNSGWKLNTKPLYSAFRYSLELGEKNPMTIGAGIQEDKAFLQTADVDGRKFVRKIAKGDLSDLLESSGCDLSLTLLRPEEGHYQTIIENVFKQHLNIKAHNLDKTAVRKLFSSILAYSRGNLQDTRTYDTLRTLNEVTVTDFMHGWYAVEIWGMGWHGFANLLASKNGKSMPATPENCLKICREDFLRKSGNIDSIKRLCSKILEASHGGVIVSRNDDIPGYEKKPLPEGKEQVIKPISRYVRAGKITYTFFAYEHLGGHVWQCELTIEKKTISWKMEEVEKDIGDAKYLM